MKHLSSLCLMAAFSLVAIFPTLGLRAESLEMWISSHQDQVYYEKMAELFREKTKKKLALKVSAYGFREMPDKLGVAFRRKGHS